MNENFSSLNLSPEELAAIAGRSGSPVFILEQKRIRALAVKTRAAIANNWRIMPNEQRDKEYARADALDELAKARESISENALEYAREQQNGGGKES